MSETRPLTGVPRSIGKRYELLKELGQGGMARVWLAQEAGSSPSAPKVAIKEPRVQKDELVSRLYREARAHYHLRESSAIVKMLGFEHPEGGDPFLVLELMLGGNLKELLAAFSQDRGKEDRLESGLPHGLAVKLGMQVARAISDMHGRDFAHRDLKPHNLLLREPREQIRSTLDATLKLSDLGIVSEVLEGPDDTQPGSLVGTWHYAPPECLDRIVRQQSIEQDLESAQRGDIFSLGLILYEIWMGVPLFKTKARSSNGATDGPRRAGELLEELDRACTRLKSPGAALSEQEDIYGLIMRMLERDPKGRPKAEEVLAHLEGLYRLDHSTGSTVSSVGKGTGSFKAAPRPRRHLVGGVAGVAALVLAVWGGVRWRYEAESAAPPAPPAPANGLAPSPPAEEERMKDSAPRADKEERPSAEPPASLPAPGRPASTAEIPARETALPEDDAFTRVVQTRGVKLSVKGEAQVVSMGQDLWIESRPGAAIISPGELEYVAYSTNTPLQDADKTPTFGMLLRHKDSSYYSVLKGFREEPTRKKSYLVGNRIGYAGEKGVVQRLITCEQPLMSWKSMAENGSGCQTVPVLTWWRK